MSKPLKLFRARTIPDATLRRLRSTPSYFFLIWRWSMWLYALVVIVSFKMGTQVTFYNEKHAPQPSSRTNSYRPDHRALEFTRSALLDCQIAIARPPHNVHNNVSFALQHF